jgi:hypothetical protein
MLPIYTDENILNTNLLNINNYKLYLQDYNYDLIDDLLDNLKYITYIYYINNKSILNIHNNNFNPVSYTSVIDNFRSDFEENN